MNDLSVFVYFLCFAAVAGATFAYMYAMMTSTLRDFNRQQEKTNVHPEMEEVKSGDELLFFNLEEDDDEDEGNITVVRR
jgi:hypothetical protein|tara:strand:+ start:461 stop:697 length:237 start_codon:yes stop_codon:yes gene_type:complete